ncbi:inner membrane CreD family protein [Pseudoalteromonas prydzensis]|uniref:inner membrane CreD family protein n=1 Tax=Pseudoalteromonas prydzensis TaxID=182141 RepID=UPI003FD59D17
MKQKLETKLVIIIGLIVLLLVPIFMIQNLIDERAELQQQVQADIAKSSSGEQQVIGPFIQVQFIETHTLEGNTTEQLRTLLLLPETLTINSELSSFEKYRGIYKALLYRSANHFAGQFNTEALNEIADKKIKQVHMIMAIKDIRGIGQGSAMRINNQEYALQPGTKLLQLPEGVNIELDYSALLEQQTLDYQIDLNLQGMRKLAM